MFWVSLVSVPFVDLCTFSLDFVPTPAGVCNEYFFHQDEDEEIRDKGSNEIYQFGWSVNTESCSSFLPVPLGIKGMKLKDQGRF